MTDKITEALARAIHCHDGRLPTPWDADMIARWPDDCEYERKVAMSQAAAVLELVGPRPLVWGMVHHRGTDFIEARSSITGTYSLRCTERGYTIIWLNERPLHPVVHGAHFSYGTLEAAQAAAQAHADAAHWANTALGDMIGGE